MKIHRTSIHALLGLLTVTACPPPAPGDDSAGTTTGGPDSSSGGSTTTATTDPTSTGTAGSTGAANSPPTAPVVAIDPSAPDRKATLTCVVTGDSTDPDGDAVTLAFAWTRDGVDAGIAAASVPADQLEVGQQWTCAATPSDGTDAGPPGQASATIGPVCAGLDFDGVDDVITAENLSPAFWTIEAWVKQRANSGQRVIVSELDPNLGFANFELGLEGGRPYVFAPDGQEFKKVQSPDAITQDEWHHLAGIYDGDNLRLAVDGVLDPQIVHTKYAQIATQPLQVGSRLASGFFFDGEIFEVRVSTMPRYAADFTPAVGFAPDDQTLLLWRLDEGAGTVAEDSSETMFDGAIMSGAAWTNACPGAAADACASLELDDVVTAEHVAVQQWTVEAWFYPRSDQAQQAIVSQVDNVNESFKGFEIGLHDGEPYMFGPDGAAWNKVTFGSEVALDQWHHIAGMYDGATVTIAVDGKLGASALPSVFVDGTTPLQIGGRLSADYMFTGAVAEVRVSDVARYAADFAPTVGLAADANTLGLWRLDEGQGALAGDASGGANDGAIAGMAAWSTMCPG